MVGKSEGFGSDSRIKKDEKQRRLAAIMFTDMVGYTALAQTNEAISEMGRAEELDPLSPMMRLRFGVVYMVAREYGKAREKCVKMLEIQPNSARGHMLLALLSVLESRYDEAVKEAEKSIGISDEAFFQEFLGYVYAASGRREQALEVLNGLVAGKYKGYASPAWIGSNYFALGDRDHGFEWLERAYAVRSSFLPISHNWPTWDSVRDDERFREIMRKMNL